MRILLLTLLIQTSALIHAGEASSGGEPNAQKNSLLGDIVGGGGALNSGSISGDLETEVKRRGQGVTGGLERGVGNGGALNSGSIAGDLEIKVEKRGQGDTGTLEIAVGNAGVLEKLRGGDTGGGGGVLTNQENEFAEICDEINGEAISVNNCIVSLDSSHADITESTEDLIKMEYLAEACFQESGIEIARVTNADLSTVDEFICYRSL